MRMKALVSAAILAAGLSPAAAETLLDYRDPAFLAGSPFYSQAERRLLTEALAGAPDGLGEALGDAFAIRGDAEGSFTTAGAGERIYLIQEEAAVAIEPFPEASPPVLVVMRDGKAAGFFRLPGDVQYQRLVAAADADGDGIDEVLLESSFMNMGQTSMALDVVALGKDGSATVAQTLQEIYQDGCGNPTGERRRAASVIALSSHGITAERHEEACPQ